MLVLVYFGSSRNQKNISLVFTHPPDVTGVCSACGLSGRSWPCAGLRWNAPECADCDGMRWTAPIAPNCADLRRLRRLRRLHRIAPIALEFCLQPGTERMLPCGCRSLVLSWQQSER